MRPVEFDYDLPRGLIAQEPPARRDASRLMVVDAAAGTVSHRRIVDLPDLLSPADLLVINDTRVRPARLHGRRAAPGTGGRVEALLVERLDAGPSRQLWSALVKGSRGEGDALEFAHGVRARVAGRRGDLFVLEISLESGPPASHSLLRDEPAGPTGGGALDEAIDRAGVMPLPPYIRRGAGDPREAMDRSRYQTVFAREDGAVAAPTASLHFTPEILDRIRARGTTVESLTLHVGPGTFLPVRAPRVEDHRLEGERCVVSGALADAVARARRCGGRVVAAGTTVTRALEWRAAPGGLVTPGDGLCDLFIVPGHRFRVVDALLTNFHLPRSTLLMLVCAFAGTETILAAYGQAVRERYRFYSYGDAMFLTPPGPRG